MGNAQIKTIEKLIGCGQVEELVQQAKDELSLIEDYYRGRLLGELTCRVQNLGRTEGRESLSVTKWYLLSNGSVGSIFHLALLLLQIEQFFPQLRDEFQGLILRRLHVLLHSFYCI